MPASLTTYRASEQDRQKYRRVMENSPRFGQAFASDLAVIVRAFPDSPLTPEEHLAINYYTGSAYDTVNAVLRGDRERMRAIVHRWNQFRQYHFHTTIDQVRAEGAWNARLMISGLNNLPAYVNTAYRVTSMASEQIAGYVIGEEIVEAAFFSANKEGYRNRWGNTYLCGTIKTGT